MEMRIFIAIIIIIIITGFFSCSKRETDEKILNDIFQDLTVEMYLHNDVSSNLFPPPPLPPIDYENDSLRQVDSIFYQKAIDRYENQLKEQKLKGNNVVLAIGDSLILYSKQDLEYLKQELPSPNYLEAFKALKEKAYKPKRIDLNAISETGNFELRYLSTFYPLKDFWETERNYKFSGFIQFSKIYLDEKSQHGIFYCSYSCGHLCGHGDFVLIRKINGKWIIEKTIEVWIS